MLSLPAVLQTTLADVPADIPYLAPDEESLAAWRDEFKSDPLFKIGIAWQGNRSHPQDRWRSFPLRELAGIARLDGVRLYSLQMGEGREQLAEVSDWPIVDLGDRVGDFHNTAAIMRNLDLVIACDSAAAHLAGALGAPVWLALMFSPDWRWMLERNDSPWYPTMRLFRQRHPGDWASVFDSMRQTLVAMLGNDPRVGRRGQPPGQ